MHNVVNTSYGSKCLVCCGLLGCLPAQGIDLIQQEIFGFCLVIMQSFVQILCQKLNVWFHGIPFHSNLSRSWDKHVDVYALLLAQSV